MAGNVPIGTPKHVRIWNFERGDKRVGRKRAGRIKAEMSNDMKQPKQRCDNASVKRHLRQSGRRIRSNQARECGGRSDKFVLG